METEKTLTHTLLKLQGQRLSAITFIHDYLQLTFDSESANAVLNVYSQSTLNTGHQNLIWLSNGFTDLLRLCINQFIMNTLVNECRIPLYFSNGVALLVPYGSPDHPGPESFELKINCVEGEAIWVVA